MPKPHSKRVGKIEKVYSKRVAKIENYLVKNGEDVKLHSFGVYFHLVPHRHGYSFFAVKKTPIGGGRTLVFTNRIGKGMNNLVD